MQIITVGKKRYDFPDEVSRDEIESIIDRDNKNSPTNLEPTDYASVAWDLAKPTQSKLESAAIGAATAVVPSAAFLGGMGAGAALMAPLAPVTFGIAPVVGGLVAGSLAAWGASTAQEYALDKILDEDTKKYIAEKGQENPGYTRVGSLLASGFKPSLTIEKTALELLKNRGAPAALGAVITAAPEVWANRNEPGLVSEGAGKRIMEAAAEMALLNQTTRAGKAVEKFGGSLVPDKLVRGMKKIAGTPPPPPVETSPPVVTDVAAETDLAENNRRISERLKRNDAMYEAQLREEGRAEGGSSTTPTPKSPRNRQEPPPLNPEELPINREFDKQDVIDREIRREEVAEEARIKAVQELQRVQELEHRQKKEDEALNSNEPPPSNVIAGPDTPLENLIGTRVKYGEITGILVRDAEGRPMVMPEVRNKSDPLWHEVEGGGNALGDPDIRAADLRIVPLEPARATVKRPPEVPPIPEIPVVIPRGPLPVSPVSASSPPPRNSFITPVELMPNTGSFLYRGGSSPTEGYNSPYLTSAAELNRAGVPAPVAEVSAPTEANLKLQKFTDPAVAKTPVAPPVVAARKLPPDVPIEKPPVDSGLVQDIAEKKAYLDELLAAGEITPELHAEEISLNQRRLTNPVPEVAPPIVAGTPGAKALTAGQNALARIAKRRAEGRVSANPLPDLADSVIYGTELITDGVVDFTKWSNKMVSVHGESIIPHLEGTYLQAVSRAALATPKGVEDAVNSQKGIPQKAMTEAAKALTAVGSPALEGTNKLPSIENTSRDIEVRLSASTSEIPGIAKLAAEVTSGDRVSSQLLSYIARDSIKYLFKDIKSAKITYQPTTGRYGQSIEASLGLGINLFDDRELPAVLIALSRFSKNYKQQEIHVLGEAKGPVGGKYPDGSFNTLVYTWKVPKLSSADITYLAKNSGFKGFTLAKGKLETYFVENVKNEKQIRQFRDAESTVSKLFGPANEEIRRLWIYGAGKIPLPKVPDSVPAPSKTRNATAQRVATILASRKVKPVAQARALTPEQKQFQTEIAREYGELKDDNLADPSVRRAYRELAAELLEQFDSIPVVIEFYPLGKDPYPNSAAMREDVLGNTHLYIYKTQPSSFGPPGVVYKNHPLLESSGRVDANGKEMLNNDILRAAHDYYAHTLSPVQFGVLGEEAAARNHAAMTRSPWARWALMTETRGQNSYFNRGPNAVWNRNNPRDVIYAPQKADLLPIRFAKSGDPVLDAEMDVIASKSSQPVAVKPRGSFPSAKDRGAISVDMLSSLGQTLGGGTAGFAYGYNKDPEASKEERVSNGIQWALFGAAVGTKSLRSAVFKGITTAKIPLGLLPESMRNSAFGGANNFVIFTKGVLGELQTAIKSQSAETAALAYKAVQSLEAMESMRGKVSNADWSAAMAHLGSRGSPSLIADRKLQSLAKIIRTEIDDFSLDMLGRGYAESGSDLETTILFNNGKYLTRTYELFTNPDFKPDPKLRDKVISEYVDQAKAEGSTKPTSELEIEGLAMAINIVAKREGSALAPKGANLAMGNGYARTDGSMFKPRKNLSDAISKYMGKINDPLVAASYTVDRMAHFLGASITQSKMAEVGLDPGLGLFSRTPDNKYTVKLSDVSSEYSPKPEGSTGNFTDKNGQSRTWVVRNGEVVDAVSGVSLQSSTADVGPLAPLYTTPEVSDALRTLSAYGKNGPLVRILASTTGLMKIANTALNPESYSPNFIGSVVAVLSQGSAAKVLFHPTKTGTALRISFSDILPVKSETLSNDVQFLIRERILRHGVNAQDVVDTFKNSVFSNMGRSSNSILFPATKVVKKVGSGMLNAYQKMEEVPRLIGFYAEVNKYSDALYNRLPEQLTTAERLAVYKKAATVVRENYPNYAEVPEVLRLASLSGGLPPFISWSYEAYVRNPYNTVLRAKAEMAEGFKTGNTKLTAVGVNRLSWFIGTMVGSVAVATAISKQQGLSDDQEKAARYFMPPWDKNSPLIFPEVTDEEIAYANQSYLNPQVVLGQSIDDAIKGKTPQEATYNFVKSLADTFISDGGLLIRPMSEAISGTDSYGNKVYTENAGGLFDVSKLSGGTRDAAISAQQFVERYVIHGFKNIVPRAIKVVDKYLKASNEEVGPNGQVYKIDDLNSRLMGLRINRMDLKTAAENKAASLSGEMHEATTSFSRARNAKNVTPKSLDAAYNLYEQQRYAVWLKMQEYLQSGNVLGRQQQELLDNLSGVDTETKIGLITDIYTPANKEKALSARDILEALQNLPAGQRDAEWASLVNADPMEARKIMSLIKEEAREDLRGLTGPDKMLQKLDHEERARTIAILLSKIPDQNEKEREWDRISSTGLLRGRTGAILTHPDSGPLVWAEARATLERNLKRNAR